MPKYKVKSRLFYKGKTAEVGDVVDDLPSNDIPWLADRGDIELVPSQGRKKTTLATAEEEDED